jgi:hypothetical protein
MAQTTGGSSKIQPFKAATAKEKPVGVGGLFALAFDEVNQDFKLPED